MTTLRLLADLLLIAPRLALAWLKTKLPSRRVLRSRHCLWCGWIFWWEPGTFVICKWCVDGESDRLRRLEEPLSVRKLFCCDRDLEEQARGSELNRAPGVEHSLVRRYCCPACGRIWLYIMDWHKDSGSEADWYPQWTAEEACGNEVPPLYDERTRTKVYEVKS